MKFCAQGVLKVKFCKKKTILSFASPLSEYENYIFYIKELVTDSFMLILTYLSAEH